MREGKRMEPDQPGQIMETPLGELKHYGQERKVAWSLTGWNFADKRLVKNSRERE